MADFNQTPIAFAAGEDDNIDPNPLDEIQFDLELIVNPEEEPPEEIDDEALIQFLENYETEREQNHYQDEPHPRPPQKRRHAQVTNVDLDQLEFEKDEANTKQITKWAVRTFNGKKMICKKQEMINKVLYNKLGK